MATTLAVAGLAAAATCTFTSTGGITYHTYTGQSLKFQWDTTTDTIIDDTNTCGSSTNDVWDDYESGVHSYLCVSSSYAGTVQDGALSTTDPTRYRINIPFVHPNTHVYRLDALIAGKAAAQGSTPVRLAGIVESEYTGYTAPLSGYGNVTCN
jgi:hypothetical protein